MKEVYNTVIYFDTMRIREYLKTHNMWGGLKDNKRPTYVYTVILYNIDGSEESHIAYSYLEIYAIIKSKSTNIKFNVYHKFRLTHILYKHYTGYKILKEKN